MDPAVDDDAPESWRVGRRADRRSVVRSTPRCAH